MKILGIETSCDETAAAVVENGTVILSNVVATSKKLHEKTGGIIPEIAAREQLKCIIPVIEEALNQAVGSKQQAVNSKIDAIAVTVGPGLIGSLLVGVETAKTIAMVTGKPVIGVNHIFAHMYANFITNQESRITNQGKNAQHITHNAKLSDQRPTFPAIALVASGGHTELFLMYGHGKLKWLGGTMDDAAGEAFDKTARMIGLGYGGGAAIATEAKKFPISKLPRPMMHDESLNFSFSGLKTAVQRELKRFQEQYYNDINHCSKRNNGELPEVMITQFAYEIQEAITDVLVAKTLKAAEQYGAMSVLLGGGVAANQRLREKFESRLRQDFGGQVGIRKNELGIALHVPEPKLCTDNAAVIASYAYFNNHPVDWRTIEAQPNLSVEVT